MTRIALVAAVVAASALQWHEPTEGVAIAGAATYMNPGRMQQVLDYWGQTIPDGVIPVALNRRGDKGRLIWLVWPSGRVDTAVVVDCAAAAHYTDRVTRHRVVEVPAWVAMREGFYKWGPWPVTVFFQRPPLDNVGIE